VEFARIGLAEGGQAQRTRVRISLPMTQLDGRTPGPFGTRGYRFCLAIGTCTYQGRPQATEPGA